MSYENYRDFFADCERNLAPVPFALSKSIGENERFKRASSVRVLLDWLKKRVVCRCRPSMYDPLVKECPLSELALVADIHWGLLEDHFGNPLNLDDLGRAFILFAGGELADEDPAIHHQPESADYYCWLEFAFACVENCIREKEYAKIIPILGASEEVYALAHSPTGNRDFVYMDYNRSTLGGKGRLSVGDMLSIVEQYTDLSINEVFVRSARNSFKAFRGLYSKGESPDSINGHFNGNSI